MRLQNIAGLSLLALCCLFAAPAGAGSNPGGASADTQPEPMRIDETVVTATGYKTKVFDAPAGMNVITAEDLEERGAVSMEDVFRGEAGLNASTTGPNSVRPMIRGLYDERVLVLVNGVRLSEQRPGGNHILSLDPAQIDRVEVVRGPSSVLYGSDAIGGVINIITKQPDESTGPETRTSFSASAMGVSNPEGWRASGGLGFGQGPANGLVGGFFRDSENMETPQGELNNSSYRGGMAWAAGNYLGEQWRWDFNYYYMQADMGIPAAPVFISDKFKDEKQHFLTAKMSREGLANWADRFEMTMGVQRHERRRERIRTSPNPSVVLGNLKVDISVDIDTFSLKPVFFKKIGERHQLTYGLDSFYENASSGRTLADTASGWVNPRFNGVPVIPDSQRLGFGLFAQDEIRLAPRWSLTAGLRCDWIESQTDGHARHQITSSSSQHDSALSGSLGVVFKASPAVNLYANLGRAFRAPTLLERYFFGPHDGPKDDVGDPDLNPETSWSFDVGAKLKTPWASGAISMFYNRIDDYIVKQDTGDAMTWMNLEEAVLYGWELWFDAAIYKGLSAFTTASYVIGQNQADDSELPSMPPLNGRTGLRLGHDFGGGQRAWAEFSALWALEQDKTAPNEKETGAWARFDFRAGYNLDERNKVTFAVENIGDRLYYDHISRTWQDLGLSDQPGRAFKVSLDCSF